LPCRVRASSSRSTGAEAGAGVAAGAAAIDGVVGELARRQNELAGLRVQKIEHKAVDQFDSMTDDELRQYVYGNKDLDAGE
jgi:hypothetical protein